MTVVTKRYALSLVHYIPEDYVGVDCARLHGHDFKVEISLCGQPDAITGEVYSRRDFDAVVFETLIQPFDKKVVNDQLEHGTGEFLAQEFTRRLKTTPLAPYLAQVQIVETRNNRFQSVVRETLDL